MSKPPSVSVVIVFHNTRDFLDEAVQSVLQQSYPDWELLLVDDGSTDGTDQLARTYVEQHEAVRYLHHPDRQNRGISASRNLGTASARGRYIAQLDSDDVWLPNHLENLVRLLEAHGNVEMVHGPVERWYSWSGKPEHVEGDFVARPLDEYNARLEPPALVPIVLQRRYGVPLGFVARREAMLAVGGYEDEFRGMHDDQVFLCKFGLRHRIYVTDRCTYRYRRHLQSIVSVTNTPEQKLLHRKRFLSWLSGYLEEQEIRDARVWKPLKQELWKVRHPHLARHRAQVMDLGGRIYRRLRRTLSGAAAPASQAQ